MYDDLLTEYQRKQYCQILIVNHITFFKENYHINI